MNWKSLKVLLFTLSSLPFVAFLPIFCSFHLQNLSVCTYIFRKIVTPLLTNPSGLKTDSRASKSQNLSYPDFSSHIPKIGLSRCWHIGRLVFHVFKFSWIISLLRFCDGRRTCTQRADSVLGYTRSAVELSLVGLVTSLAGCLSQAWSRSSAVIRRICIR